MRALLVTSEITYVPRNYQDMFEALFARVPEMIAGLVLLKVIDRQLLKTIAGLYALGCPRVATTMVRNIAELPLKRREALFEKWGLPVLRAESMNKIWMTDWIKRHKIDLVINLRTRCIYKKRILTTPTYGCVNVHHGVLPRYRGTMCDLFALSEGRPAGFSIHEMVRKIDAGRLLHVEEVSPGAEKDYIRHLGRSGRYEGAALARVMEQIDKLGALPDGTSNVCDDPVMTTTPTTREEIDRLKQLGMLL
jgi:methionyl-tRNA formyltransferase